MKKIKRLISYCLDKWQSFINLKYINVFFKVLPHNFFVFLLLIMSIITLVKFNIYSVTDYISVYEINELDSNIGPILEQTKIDLSFVETDEKFSSLCFRVGTYSRKNDVKFTLNIINNNKKVISDTIEAENLVDGGYACFDIEKLSLTDLKESEIYLSPDDSVSADNTITIFQNKEQNLAVSLVNNQDASLHYFVIAMFIIFIIVYLLINYIINKYNVKVNSFLLLMLCYIIPILFIMPVFQVPDEPAHFYRSYHLSQYDSSDGIYNGFFDEEIEVPSNIGCLNYANVQLSDRVSNFDDVKKCFASEENIVIEEEHVGNSSLLGYIVQTIAIKVADIFTNSPMVIFYFGRIVTFVCSFILVYLAIKITPRYKYLFLIVATMMMFIQQIISYSYDSLLNAIALLYVAYVLNLIYKKEKVCYRDWLYIIIMLLFMNVIKRWVYLPLAVLLLFIPSDKFKNKSNKNKIIAVILCVLSVVLLYKCIDSITNIDSELVKRVSESKEYTSEDQLKYLLSNPIDILKIAIETVKVNGMFYLNGLIGYFGWFRFKVSDKYILFYLLLFIYAIFGESSKLKFKNKIFLLGGICISIVATFGAMYLYWSDYMLPYVEGVQGRYFIPLLIPFVMLFIPKTKKYVINDKIIFSSINILLLQYILTLVLWYY